ncbi:ankyrin repeat-containing protein ITN1-like [Vigna umbellata]|uniref:ankyrin repeat-containing protein ITN1-like n=1 Tax=Vigna umbellata TaxID=87088 RepID=UPI001F5F655C|nr:ankyrin repeat-containing protein ITN1-like [Vigna umbellata]
MLPIVKKDPNSVRIQLNRLSDRALHVAASAGSTAFVEELIKFMRPEDVLIHNSDEMLPVHLAALSFHHRIVQLLCSHHLLDKMAYKDIEKLFFMTISNNMFDVAITLFEKHPLALTRARDKEELTSSLHMLARKPYEVLVLLTAVDNEGNNVLHLAALLAPQFKSFSGLSAKFQMDKELSWFKDAERRVPPGLKSMKNKKGKTPVDVFFDEHNQLSKDIKESAKGIANSGMVVATLVATVAFAAALTVPGDKNNVWFIVFIVTNAIALFTSSASILSFLTNFISSRFADTEFVISVHPSLYYGLQLLMISVSTLVYAFIATSFLIFDHTTKWVSYAVTPMGFSPLLVFILFQSKFWDDSYWSKYYRPDPKLGRET